MVYHRCFLEHVLSLARISTSLFITGHRVISISGISRMLDLRLACTPTSSITTVIEEQLRNIPLTTIHLLVGDLIISWMFLVHCAFSIRRRSAGTCLGCLSLDSGIIPRILICACASQSTWTKLISLHSHTPRTISSIIRSCSTTDSRLTILVRTVHSVSFICLARIHLTRLIATLSALKIQASKTLTSKPSRLTELLKPTSLSSSVWECMRIRLSSLPLTMVIGT